MPRKQHDYHYIYKTTCNITNKYYIGLHSTSNLDDGYMGSGKRLRYSINKYGKENHTKEILEFCESRKTLIEREADIINETLLNDLLCMNLVLGGASDSYRKKLNKRKFKNLSESHKENLSKAAIGKNGKYERTEEIKTRIANTIKDTKQSDETKKKRSESLKKFWLENEKSKELRRQKSERMKGNNYAEK